MTLSTLYAGQPTRATARPTTEQLLRAFKNITLTVWQGLMVQESHLPPLMPMQERILKLLKFPATLYAALEGNSFTLAPKMSGP